MRTTIFIIFLIYGAITFGAVAANGIKYPLNQIFIDTKNHESLYSACHPLPNGNIECKDTKVGVVHKPSEDFLDDWLNNRKQTCVMYSTTTTDTFQYNAETGDWVFQSGQPYGPCGEITAGYFKKDNKFKNSDSWNYTEKTIYTSNTGNAICSRLHDHKSNYDGIMSLKHFDGTQRANCKYIDFSQTIVVNYD